MYCSLGQNQFFDDAGAPLSAGRVKIYAKGSDTLLPIYEDNGDGFVPTQNPVITANDGRIPTVFWPAALVDVVVEKNNGDGTYTELDSYVAGLDLSSVEAVQGTGSIAELRSIMPSENMVVQVNGYYTAGDSPTRKYLWVAGAANTDDGGYVISSNRDYNGGRWVMLWDDPEFLPVSLYGVMCGYYGYAKTSGIPALESLGHYVIVGSVRVEVPPVILFDWRMAQPTSGQSSPVAYHWSGTFTTTHYVACARGVDFSATSTPPTIHCAGVRGESYANAYWLVDQDYTTKDPMEKISTLMFNGNTWLMHDAFMACAACSKVKVVELYDNSLYSTLISSDDIQGKIIVDYVLDGNSPDYHYSNSVVFRVKNGTIHIQMVSADVLQAFTRLSTPGELNVLGSVFFGSDLTVRNGVICTDPSAIGVFPKGVSMSSNERTLEFGDIYETSSGTTINKDNIKVNVKGIFRTPFCLEQDTSPEAGFPHLTYKPSSLTTIRLGVGYFVSKYTENDIILISNFGTAALNVQTGGSTVVLNPYQSGFFVKRDDGDWNEINPA